MQEEAIVPNDERIQFVDVVIIVLMPETTTSCQWICECNLSEYFPMYNITPSNRGD